MKTIEWVEQYENFGLDYSTKTGKWEDYRFDIRYDYDGNPKAKPDCGLVLTISKRGQRVHPNIFDKNIDNLVFESILYLQEEQRKFLNAKFD